MQKRSIWTVLGLSLATLGIYQLYWLYKTRNEMIAKGNYIPSFIYILVPFTISIALIINQILQYLRILTSGQPLADNIGAGGENISRNLLVSLALFAIFGWWWYHYTKAVERVTDGRISFDLSFWIGLVLSYIGFGVLLPPYIQNGFNQTSDDSPESQPPYPKI